MKIPGIFVRAIGWGESQSNAGDLGRKFILANCLNPAIASAQFEA